MHMIRPGAIFTIGTQDLSKEVLRIIDWFAPRDRNFDIQVFPGTESVITHFSKDGPPAVALFDDLSSNNGFGTSGAFTYFSRVREVKSVRGGTRRRIPIWAFRLKRNQWAVGIHRPTISSARQIYHDFFVSFDERIASGQFPWGKPRKGEPAPRDWIE